MCYGIPANFSSALAVPIHQSKLHRLQQLEIGLRISALVEDRNAGGIIAMEKEILRVLADTGYMVTGYLLDTTLRLVKIYDSPSALRLGYKMGGLLLNQVSMRPKTVHVT